MSYQDILNVYLSGWLVGMFCIGLFDIEGPGGDNQAVLLTLLLWPGSLVMGIGFIIRDQLNYAKR